MLNKTCLTSYALKSMIRFDLSSFGWSNYNLVSCINFDGLFSIAYDEMLYVERLISNLNLFGLFGSSDDYIKLRFCIIVGKHE